MDTSMDWVSEYLGWLIGTKAHCIKKCDANRPEQQKHESDVDYAKTLITYENDFGRSYRSRAWVKRALLVILVFMIFTNPRLKDFINYQKKNNNIPADLCKEKFNILFLSAYTASGHRYIGAFNTFFPINETERPVGHGIVIQDSLFVDSTAKVDTFKKYPPIEIPGLDTGANHNAMRMDSILKENSKPNPYAQPDTGFHF